MQGNQKIIDALNGLLAYELAAMDQYFLHSEMYKDWGLNKLHERIAHEFDDEKGHAQKLIERMLFLEGTPDMTQRGNVIFLGFTQRNHLFQLCGYCHFHAQITFEH